MSILTRFRKSRKGAVLAFVALLLPALILLMGFIIDIGRVLIATMKLQTVVDASALAAANTAVTVNDGVNPPYAVIPSSDGTSAATSYFWTNYNLDLANWTVPDPTTPTINPEGDANYSNGKVHVVATVSVPLTLSQLVGVNDVKITCDSWSTASP